MRCSLSFVCARLLWLLRPEREQQHGISRGLVHTARHSSRRCRAHIQKFQLGRGGISRRERAAGEALVTTRTIKVDYIARVEGEGALYVRIKNGQIADVKFKI